MSIKINGSALGESILDDIKELIKAIHGAFPDRIEVAPSNRSILEKFWVKNVMVDYCCKCIDKLVCSI